MHIASEEDYERQPVILFADDDDVVLDIGIKMLQFMDYQVLAAKTGQEAIEIFENHPNGVDLIIMDLNMPHGGEAALAQLKKMDSKVKILITSGSSDDHLIGNLMDHGCDGFISKPWTISMLSKMVKTVLKIYPN
jgi:two-component system cell cycle sensor histidine kinase/response regulator CckA